MFLQGARELLLNLAYFQLNAISAQGLLYFGPFIGILIVLQPYLTVSELFVQFHLLFEVVYESFGLPGCDALLLYVVLHWNHLYSKWFSCRNHIIYLFRLIGSLC